ncbi:MAG: glycosyltransferase family 4 protein [Candidatus Nanoarchaeia archaeon]
MDSKINVRLLSGSHPIYETLLKYPPANITYLTNIKSTDFETLKIYQSKNYNFKKSLVLSALNLLRLPRIYFVINSADVIHSSRGLLILNRSPWVVDVEHASSFGDYTKKQVRFLVKQLLKSKYCKKILPHCEAARKSILNGYDCKDFRTKLEVLYPAIMPHKIAKANEIPTILFIGKWVSFYRKGGKELIQAFKILEQKYDINLILKTDAPREFIKKYEKDRSILFAAETISREEVFEKFYLKSDIFVMPTFVDSFGYVFLEAMSCGLPVVGTDIFAVPEIIENGKNGFLVHSNISDFKPNFLHRDIHKSIDYSKIKAPEVVRGLVEALTILIENKPLRKKMGRTGYKMVESGKFSIKQRNEKLKRIYEEAIE